ncbi:MAG: thioesterase family protein [Anaerolineales bacterium]|nr:thioesterase family protein [Anaerolineales bacterium]
MIDPQHLEPLPLYHRATVPDAYLDVMGHMNIRYYLALFDEAAWQFFDAFGMNRTYYESTTGGAFALEQHIRYFAEVRRGETVSIRTRVLGFSPKRIHFMLFMVNETAVKLAATLETVTSHVDLTVRRTSPFPSGIAVNIAAFYEAHCKLPWDAPSCGVMSA